MTNQDNLSNRAKQALEVLANGGKFVHRLERNSYTGRDLFQYRLLQGGRAVRGIGFATFYELNDRFLKMCDGGNTSVSTYYELKGG